MLMVAIITWRKDVLFQLIHSMEEVKRLKRVLGGDRDFVLYEGVFLCPIKMDHATRQLMEDEVLEFLKEEAYPELIAEGRMELKNGRAVYITKNKNNNGGK